MSEDDQAIPVADPFVRRFNDLTTTVLDAVATLALGVGAWVWADANLGPGASWGLAALVVLLFSGLAQRRNQPRRPVKVPKGAHPHLMPLPGPEDAGNLHVKGR